MTSLYEIAINGLGVGSKAEDLQQMYKDHEGYPLAQAILMDLMMKLDDLERSTRAAARESRALAEAVARFQVNQNVSNAEWLTNHADKVEKYTREAQAAYSAVGQAWRLWQLQTA